MKTVSQKATYKAQSENIADLPASANKYDTRCACIDPRFDELETDEAKEIAAGLERHALAHGEVVR